jgi:hypothetical protein
MQISRRLGLFKGCASMLGAALALCLCMEALHAQDAPPADAGMKAAIVDSVSAALAEGYVFPEVGAEMAKLIRKNLKRGNYENIDSIDEFAEALARDLREVCHDGHLSVAYIPPDMMEEFRLRQNAGDDRERTAARLAKDNFMFKKLEILAGNVGYLRLDAFVDATYSGATAVAAMNFLAHCDALIIDLRYNGGGSPSLIQLLTSYFYVQPTHLNSFYTPNTDSLQQFWTHAYVPGPRMTDVELYVLTSGRTFSGAEEFTYNLKNLERATIVGETTGGGAHPVNRRLFPTLNISVGIPFGRAINPLTGTNWEGTGVTPHIEIQEDKALPAAHAEALRKLRDGSDDPAETAGLEWAIQGIEAELNPTEIPEDILRSFAGTYGPRTLSFKNGALYYAREGNPERQAVPMGERLFRFEDLDFFRLEVVVDDSGSPIKLIGHYDMGLKDESPRTGD